MSIALQNRVNELEERVADLEKMVKEFIESGPVNGNNSMELRVRDLENKYRMLNARVARA